MKDIILVFALLITAPYLGISQTVESMNKPTIDGLDWVAPFSEGLAAVRKGNQWGFIDKTGKLVIDFRGDIVWNANADTTKPGVEGVEYPKFKEGLCIIQEMKEEDIPYYGFMDTSGKVVIEPDYLNVTEFDDGKAIGIYGRKDFRGKNKFQLNIYDYTFTEVLLNTKGEMLWPIAERQNILMSKKRYQTPEIRAEALSDNLLRVKNEEGKWEVRKIDLNHQN
jgi:hypothetical protein